MSDLSVATEPFKGTVGYTRKVNLGNYESEDASLYIQFDINPDASMETVIADARDAFFAAKATVLEQLGIECVLDEDGVIRAGATVAQVSAALPVASVQAAPAPVAVAAAPAPAPAAGGDWFGKRGKSSPKTQINGQDGWDLLAADASAFYDNRPSKADGSYKANAPDFKHKDTGTGLWQS